MLADQLEDLQMTERPKLYRLYALMLVLLCSPPAYAYLDPGTLSMVGQGLVAGIAGLLVFLKTNWVRIRSLFTKTKKQASKGE